MCACVCVYVRIYTCLCVCSCVFETKRDWAGAKVCACLWVNMFVHVLSANGARVWMLCDRKTLKTTNCTFMLLWLKRLLAFRPMHEIFALFCHVSVWCLKLKISLSLSLSLSFIYYIYFFFLLGLCACVCVSVCARMHVCVSLDFFNLLVLPVCMHLGSLWLPLWIFI